MPRSNGASRHSPPRTAFTASLTRWSVRAREGREEPAAPGHRVGVRRLLARASGCSSPAATAGYLATTLELAKQRAEVIVACRKTSDELEAAGVAAVYVGVDVADTASVEAFAAKLKGDGDQDVVINNAGYFYGPNEKVLDNTLNFDEQLSRSTSADWAAARHFRPLQRRVTAGRLQGDNHFVAAGSSWRFAEQGRGRRLRPPHVRRPATWRACC